MELLQEQLNVNLAGKTAMVTGGSRGVGRAISIALAQARANVVIAARTKVGLRRHFLSDTTKPPYFRAVTRMAVMGNASPWSSI